jgi:predicted RNA methylase
VTAGYSLTPQAKKLGLKADLRVALHDPPAGWELADPPDVQFVDGDEPADVIISFVRAEADLRDRVDHLGTRIFPDGALWLAWPRKAAGHVSDVTENGVRAVVLPLGLVDVKVAAIDNDWSGLKIVWRRENRSVRKS